MEKNQKENTVTLKVFNDPIEADMVQIKLHEHGIESFLEEENVLGLNPLGGTELKIFLKDLERARKIVQL